MICMSIRMCELEYIRSFITVFIYITNVGHHVRILYIYIYIYIILAYVKFQHMFLISKYIDNRCVMNVISEMRRARCVMNVISEMRRVH
jgi:hypothetical protein